MYNKIFIMPQLAITYAPNLSGGAPANTTNTGSFYVGRQIAGRVWNQTVSQTTTDTLFYSSPLSASYFTIALPNKKDAGGAGNPPTDQPQFMPTTLGGVPSKGDAAFIAACNYALQNFDTDGNPIDRAGAGPAANGVGCDTVSNCKLRFDQVGWFQDYDTVIP